MCSKNISRSKQVILSVFLIFIFFSTAFSREELEIIYPKDSQLVKAVDSTFILGNVMFPSVNTSISINGTTVKVHKDGGFIAFLPIEPGWFTFNIEYSSFLSEDMPDFPHVIDPSTVDHIETKKLTVQIPEPLTPIPFDSLIVLKEIDPPNGFLNLRTGDRLEVAFQGTPDCEAYFNIPGIADSVPMAETSPRTQPYWGESVFGSGAIPDSMLIRGIYTGYYDIPPDAHADSIHLHYVIKYPSKEKIIEHFKDSTGHTSVLDAHKLDTLKKEFNCISSSYRLSINSPEFPYTVRFTDSVQTIRHGPRMGYFSIFQPEGIEALVTGSEGDWYIAQLSETQKAYINKYSVERLPRGILPPESYLSVIRLKSGDGNITLEFPLSGKHPFRVIEDDRRTIRIQLFGVTSNTDWIRYDFSDPLIDFASWQQPEPGLYELKIALTKDIWGYDSYYNGNTFYFQLNKAPENVKSLKGKTIVIDPGHSPDKGSVGPTGYTEAEANLGLALKLRDKLVSKGARVIMTRDDNSGIGLYDRPVIAKQVDADLFISMHNNALPDGVNPFVNNGTSTYYYHIHSIDLAKDILKELTQKIKLGDYGLYHGNLAVDRPTQYPAVLVETAFMILPEQEALLKTDKFRKKVADGITKGVEEFLKNYHDRNKD